MSRNFTYQGWDLKDLFISEQYILDNLTGQELWAWGDNTYGLLGNNSITGTSIPAQTISGGTNWKQVSTGTLSTAAIKTDGTLWTWGINIAGSLGNNDSLNRSKSSPIQTVSATTDWKQVSVGHTFTAAIKTDGTLWMWGFNDCGQLGDGTRVSKSSPVQTIAGGNNWKQVSVGFAHTAAIKTDGTLWLWGCNPYGQLGDNTTTNKSSPVQTISAGTNWKQVSSGTSITGAIKTDGTLWIWGQNSLIDGTGSFSSPIQNSACATNWKQIEIGNTHAAAIKMDGTLWTWGYNPFGQLGTNNTTTYNTPTQTIAGGNNWKQVSLGEKHTAAVKTDGTLWAWGYNYYGQLGTNDTVYTSSPVQTDLSSNVWRSVNSKWCSTFALKIVEGY